MFLSSLNFCVQMDEVSREPVMWVRESSLNQSWIGHNATHGFQILRSVPAGNPKLLLPRTLDKDSFIDIHKAYDSMNLAQKEEWLSMKAASELNPQRENIQVEVEAGFDWAKPLLEVSIHYFFILFILYFYYLFYHH